VRYHNLPNNWRIRGAKKQQKKKSKKTKRKKKSLNHKREGKKIKD